MNFKGQMNMAYSIRILKIIGIMILSMLYALNFCFAESKDETMAWVGLDLYLSILSADEDIAQKKDSLEKLNILVVYNAKEKKAEEMVNYLSEKEVKGFPLNAVITDVESIKNYADKNLAGIFISERNIRDLKVIIDFSISHNLIVFSPFEEHVLSGVTSGMIINDRIVPYININTAKMAKIRIKPFFLRIAEKFKSND
ncbi:MAG: hypothetical protein HQK76_18175 [Desulfobacterales bacterium]|nr:hypothetical protein [Desulfobacterales bacterium]